MLFTLIRYGYGSFGFYDHLDIMTKMVWSQGGYIKWRVLYYLYFFYIESLFCHEATGPDLP